MSLGACRRDRNASLWPSCLTEIPLVGWTRMVRRNLPGTRQDGPAPNSPGIQWPMDTPCLLPWITHPYHKCWRRLVLFPGISAKKKTPVNDCLPVACSGSKWDKMAKFRPALARSASHFLSGNGPQAVRQGTVQSARQIQKTQEWDKMAQNGTEIKKFSPMNVGR